MKALLRIVGWAAALVAIAALVMCARIRQVRAELRDRLGELGPALETLAGDDGAPRVVTVNGAAIRLRSGTMPVDVAAALAPAHAACGDDAAEPLGATLAAIGDDTGFVACFPALRELGPEALLAAARGLLDGGDARRLGPFVYTWARRTARGTHLVEATIAELDLGAIFPRAGDAPGADVPGVARPPGARRLLSASADGQPYRFVVYAADGAAPAAVAAAYEATLAADGWDLRPVGAADGRRIVYGFRGDALIAVVVRGDALGATVTVAQEL